jgi:hypothetical protein
LALFSLSLYFFISVLVKVYEIELVPAYSIPNTANAVNTSAGSTKSVTTVKTAPLKQGKPTKSHFRCRNTEETHRQLDEKLFRSLSEKHDTQVNRTEWQEEKWKLFKAGRDVD